MDQGFRIENARVEGEGRGSSCWRITKAAHAHLGTRKRNKTCDGLKRKKKQIDFSIFSYFHLPFFRVPDVKWISKWIKRSLFLGGGSERLSLGKVRFELMFYYD